MWGRLLIGLFLLIAALFASGFALIKSKTSKTRALAATGAVVALIPVVVPFIVPEVATAAEQQFWRLVLNATLFVGLGASLAAYNKARVEAITAAIEEDD